MRQTFLELIVRFFRTIQTIAPRRPAPIHFRDQNSVVKHLLDNRDMTGTAMFPDGHRARNGFLTRSRGFPARRCCRRIGKPLTGTTAPVDVRRRRHGVEQLCRIIRAVTRSEPFVRRGGLGVGVGSGVGDEVGIAVELCLAMLCFAPMNEPAAFRIRSVIKIIKNSNFVNLTAFPSVAIEYSFPLYY
jgi:hypothetical protein